MKLLLAPLNVPYQELFPLVACDMNNKECMVHRCPNCPDTLLQDFLFHTIGDFDDDDDDIIDEYVNIVIEPLHILTVHSYISK